MAIKKSQIYSTLWSSCDALRGSMDASQYKDYVLTILFVKYLSDKGEDLLFDIPDGCRFEDFLKLRNSPKIGEEIDKKLAAIKTANPSNLKNWEIAYFNKMSLFGSSKTMVDTWSKLLSKFDKPELNFKQNKAADDDLLGDAFEYLMKNFATQSGKSKGQFYTPQEVSRLMAKILNLGEFKKPRTTIYDPACGSGSLLLRAMNETANGRATLCGQEKDVSTGSLAILNLLIHGVESATIKIGDTLNEPLFTELGNSLSTFDICVANPPFSLKDWLMPTVNQDSDKKEEEYKSDRFGRWTIHSKEEKKADGTLKDLCPPLKCGDFAFLQHLIKSMKAETGRGACILPHGVLFRGNAEYEIRKSIVDRHIIKGIIGLPANIFYGTGIPASIIIIDKSISRSSKGIFFVDAKDGYMKDGAKNRLREQDIKRISDVWNAQREIPHFSRFVPYSEIQENDYNLNIPRYIQPLDNEIQHDIYAHIHGGIPAHDVDRMRGIWSKCPSLKTDLFADGDHGGYYRMKAEGDSIQDIISGNADYQKEQKALEGALADSLFGNIEQSMYKVGRESVPKKLIAQWSDNLLLRFAQANLLVDEYDVYDEMMKYWVETMQDDCYLVSKDGWIANLNCDIKDTPFSELVCDLLPVDIVVGEFFAKEKADYEAQQNLLDQYQNELSALQEDCAEHFADFLNTDDKLDKKQLLATFKKNEKKPSVEKDVFESWKKYFELEAKIKKQKAHIKSLEAMLGNKIIAKYASFSEEEVQRLVISRKWQATLSANIKSLMQTVLQSIISEISAIQNRYANTLQDLNSKSAGLEKKVMSHLNKMGFNYGK